MSRSLMIEPTMLRVRGSISTGSPAEASRTAPLGGSGMGNSARVSACRMTLPSSRIRAACASPRPTACWVISLRNPVRSRP
jgi:hypothetical protein